MTQKQTWFVGILLLGIFLTNIIYAQDSNLSNYTKNATAELLGKNSVICKLLGVLNVFGAVAMTSGILLAGYNFLSASQEAREKGKIGTEGVLIGGGLIMMAPQIVSYIFGFAVC